MATEQQPPDVLAMVLADTVLIDIATDKKTIQGTYTRLGIESFPHNHPAIVVYTVLTDGYGATPIQLRLVDVDESDPPLFELEATVNFPDPLAVLEIVFTKREVVFPAPGEYRLQLFGAGVYLKERRLQIGTESNPGGI